MKRILFLGGTQFVGRHMVEAALARGWQVTLFNRGKTNPGIFSGCEQLIGDRDGNLDALKNRNWDAVVDVNGYLPRLVTDSATLLKDAVGQYVFISTGSVYDFSKIKANNDESGPLETLEDPTTEEYRGSAYGGLKVLCEQKVAELYPDNHLILRLGVVAGPFDHSDRVTHWVTRVARGGEMIVPVHPEQPIQFIDARDLAHFTLLGIEKRLNGIYNTEGNSVSWQHFIDACMQASGIRPEIHWVDDYDFVSNAVDLRLKPYGAFPMAVAPEMAHLWTANNDKALRAGLVYRSALNTARDILAWDATRPVDQERKAGLPLDLEQKLLETWKNRKKE